jgi:hypothetical protein
MDTLSHIVNKYNLTVGRLHFDGTPPIEIPNMGRNNLAELFGELGYKVGAEIGTERGLFAEVMCKANPGVKLFCIDAWRVYPGYRDYQNTGILEGRHAQAQTRLSPYNVELINAYSMDAVKDFADNSLDFVYIDANHEYPWVTEDVIHWSKKVRSGGIVSGHDYYTSAIKDSRCQVIPAIKGYTEAYRINPWFLVGTKAKTPGLIRDNSRSWFWVKE